MNSFQYTLPEHVDSATQIIDHQETMALAGGTTLIDLMKLNVLTPKQVVYVKPCLDQQIREEQGYLKIGAGATMAAVAQHPTVRQRFPAVRQSLLLAASPQIRNMATIGGNLLQRTRSPYFRHVDMPSDGMVSGQQDKPLGTGTDASCLAVLGNSGKLVGTYPGDFAVALVAFDGKVHLRGKGADRTVLAREFYQIPKDSPDYTTVLRSHELITAISLPLSNVCQNSIYLKIRERSSYAFALASAAVGLELNGRGAMARIVRARVAIGGLGSIPWNSDEAAYSLENQIASDASFTSAADAALAHSNPPAGTEYKVILAKRTIVRALRILRDQGPCDDQQMWAMQHGRE